MCGPQFNAVVDVREAAEVAEGMIPGAMHIPLGQVLANPDLTQFKVHSRSPHMHATNSFT